MLDRVLQRAIMKPPSRTVDERQGAGSGGERLKPPRPPGPPAPPQPPTEVHDRSPGGRDPKRRAALGGAVVSLLIVAGIAWGIPILQGFHFGCNALAGDEIRETRLGLEMCRARTQAEVNEQRENVQRQAQQEQQADERREAEERKASEEATHRQREAERPGLEADASTLRGEAAAARKRQQQQEAAAKGEEAEARRVEREETPEGGGSKLAQSAGFSAEAAEHEVSADSAKSEADAKEREAAEDEKKAAEG